MLRSDIPKKIKKIVSSVSPGAEIILYGSQARGDNGAASDIDILILVEKEHLSFHEKLTITNPIYDLELETGIQINPVIYTKKQWYNRPIKTPFYLNVLNEGIRL